MRPMRHLLCAALALAMPLEARAQITLDALVGQWQGTGTYAIGAQTGRVRCRVGIVAQEPGIALSGRCAAAAGAQDFSVALVEEGDRIVTRSESAAPLSGEIIGESLVLTGEVEGAQVTMELILSGDGLRLGMQRDTSQGREVSVVEMTR